MPALMLRDTVAGIACLFRVTHAGDSDNPDIQLTLFFPDLTHVAPATLLPEVWLDRIGGIEDVEEISLTSTRLQLVLGEGLNGEGEMIASVERLQLQRLMAVPYPDVRALLFELTEQRAVSEIAEPVRVYRELELESLYGTHRYRLQFIAHAMRLLEDAQCAAEANLGPSSRER